MPFLFILHTRLTFLKDAIFQQCSNTIKGVFKTDLKLIGKIESVIKRMRWKAHFFLNKGKCKSDNKNTFGFTSRYHPPQSFELGKFEKNLFSFINLMKFSNTRMITSKSLTQIQQNLNNLKTYLFLLIKPATFIKCRRSNIKSFYEEM